MVGLRSLIRQCRDHACDRARALVAMTSAVDVLDYTEATAAYHARLIAHARRAGTPRGALGRTKSTADTAPP